jgi:general secretion pathway protein M
MKQWFLSREPREQRALLIGAGALILMILYIGVWEPITGRVQTAREVVQQKQTDLRWMQNAMAQIRILRAQRQNAQRPATTQSLLALVDRTAKSANVREEIRRIRPQGNDRVQLWIEQAAFDPLVQWLGTLQTQYGVRVANLTVEQGEQQGLVSARLLLSTESGK